MVVARANQISIVIPALNEAEYIRATLDPLQAFRCSGHEIVLVDGGSHDRTVEIAAPFVDQVVLTTPGRARQLRAGATAARGAILWFLHADTTAPASADRDIQSALGLRQAGWGRFDISLSGQHRLLQWIGWFMNQRSRLTGIATGDQGIFVRRELYDAAGGFPDLPLMEDITFSRMLKQHSRPVCIRKKLRSSPRRWLQDGVIRTILTMWGLRIAYFIGVKPEKLVKYYVVNRG